MPGKRVAIVVEQGAIHVNSVFLLSESADMLRLAIDCRSKRFEVDVQGDGIYLWRHKETLFTVKHGRRGTWRYMALGGGKYNVIVLCFRETRRRGSHLPIWVDGVDSA